MTINKTIPVAIVLAGVLVAGALVYVNKNNPKFIPAQQAADNAIIFVNQVIASEGATNTAVLDSVAEENGSYALNFKIGTNQISGLVTKDGRFLLIGSNPYSAYDITVPVTQENSTENNSSESSTSTNQ
jgi:hypothetical protein